MEATSRWAEIRHRRLEDPQARDRYEQTRRTVAASRQILELIEIEREKAGLSKKELAARAGTSPAGMKRLLSSDRGPSSLNTLLEIFDTLGLQLSLRPKAVDPHRRKTLAPPLVKTDTITSS